MANIGISGICNYKNWSDVLEEVLLYSESFNTDRLDIYNNIRVDTNNRIIKMLRAVTALMCPPVKVGNYAGTHVHFTYTNDNIPQVTVIPEMQGSVID